MTGREPRMMLSRAVEAGKIIEIELVADPERLARLDLAMLGDRLTGRPRLAELSDRPAPRSASPVPLVYQHESPGDDAGCEDQQP